MVARKGATNPPPQNHKLNDNFFCAISSWVGGAFVSKDKVILEVEPEEVAMYLWIPSWMADDPGCVSWTCCCDEETIDAVVTGGRSLMIERERGGTILAAAFVRPAGSWCSLTKAIAKSSAMVAAKNAMGRIFPVIFMLADAIKSIDVCCNG